jgi:nitroreductase
MRRAAARCERILASMADDLTDAPWATDRWLEGVIAGAYREFDGACERWRSIYRAARRQQRVQAAIVMDTSAASESREAVQRRRGEAETQLKLLTADDTTALQSDFYSYRYYASEGFLPGYNFPRLPLRANRHGPGDRPLSRHGGSRAARRGQSGRAGAHGRRRQAAPVIRATRRGAVHRRRCPERP